MLPQAQRQEILDVQMRQAERRSDAGGLALPLKLAAIVITIACPCPVPAAIHLPQMPTGILERDAAVHLLLGQGRQAGAELADLRSHRTHQDALVLGGRQGGQIDRADTDFDDLVACPSVAAPSQQVASTSITTILSSCRAKRASFR